MSNSELILANLLALTMTPGRRYTGWRWRRVARAVRRRDRYRCQRCFGRGWHVHHIRPVGEGGAHTLDNLITLCPSCHERIHERKFHVC